MLVCLELLLPAGGRIRRALRGRFARFDLGQTLRAARLRRVGAPSAEQESAAPASCYESVEAAGFETHLG